VLDREYNSEAILRQIREVLHADSIISIRSWNAMVVGGKCHQEMSLRFDDVRYRKRQPVENMFSVLKRKSGADLKRSIILNPEEGNREEMIVCYIPVFLLLLLMEVCDRADFTIGITAHFCSSTCFRNWPVWLSGTADTSSGVPVATILPPASPPSGPISMM
jgi:hypothetical protein